MHRRRGSVSATNEETCRFGHRRVTGTCTRMVLAASAISMVSTRFVRGVAAFPMHARTFSSLSHAATTSAFSTCNSCGCVSVSRPTIPTSTRRSALIQKRSLYIQSRKVIGKEDLCAKSTLMMAVDDDDAIANEEGAKTIDGPWNLHGLKNEAARLTLRTHKKIGKASSRLESAKKRAEELMTDPDATLEQLEACPNVEALQVELDELRLRLRKLNQLEGDLGSIKGKKKETVLPPEVASLVLDLGVNDSPPKRPARGPKKKKGPKANSVSPRKPYRRYYTANKTEIRVGKQAEDNDQLSLLPEHRDGADWWMHASGCPGSHVVIRCHDAQVDQEVVRDAAALAARQSKCSGQTIKVSMVRCRDVSKPRGAKAGLVQLNGSVRTIPVNMKEAAVRLDRLDGTELIN
mmetsp:Transcript_26479/g.58048  ORF Transcript_26479/g.58048 Transcript_26479/m.58048 type:complete len:406 (-) Transcript_26479:108-1325(-)